MTVLSSSSLGGPPQTSLLQTEIPELLKFGAFADEVRLYTIHAIKPAWRSNGSVPIQADRGQLFCGKSVWGNPWNTFPIFTLGVGWRFGRGQIALSWSHPALRSGREKINPRLA